MLRNQIWISAYFRYHVSRIAVVHCKGGVQLIRRRFLADGKCFSCTGFSPGVGADTSCLGIPDPSGTRNPVLSIDV